MLTQNGKTCSCLTHPRPISHQSSCSLWQPPGYAACYHEISSDAWTLHAAKQSLQDGCTNPHVGIAGYATDSYARPGYQSDYGQHAAYQTQYQSPQPYTAPAAQFQQPAAAAPLQAKQSYSNQPAQTGNAQWGSGSYGANTGQAASRPPQSAQVNSCLSGLSNLPPHNPLPRSLARPAGGCEQQDINIALSLNERPLAALMSP